MRYAVVDNASNKVVNVIEADDALPIADHTMIASDTANIGDTYDGTNFIPPPQPPSFESTLNMGGSINEIIGR